MGKKHVQWALLMVAAGYSISAGAEVLSGEGKKELYLKYKMAHQEALDEDYKLLLADRDPVTRDSRIKERLNNYESQDSKTLQTMINGVGEPLLAATIEYEQSYMTDPSQYVASGFGDKVVQQAINYATPNLIKMVPTAKACEKLLGRIRDARISYQAGLAGLKPETVAFMDRACGKNLELLEQEAKGCSVGNQVAKAPQELLIQFNLSWMQGKNRNVALLSEHVRLGCNQARTLWREHMERVKNAGTPKFVASEFLGKVKPVGAHTTAIPSKGVAAGAMKKVVNDIQSSNGSKASTSATKASEK